MVMDLLKGCFEGMVLYESLVLYWSLFGEGEPKRHLRKNIFQCNIWESNSEIFGFLGY
jgi:hypothetical protein